MAQKVNIVLVDDIDGSAAAETVAFALDGTSYEIDLSAKNAGRLRDILADYVSAGRRAGRRTTSRGRPRGRRSPGSSEIRTWGRAHGFAVNERGRIPAELQQAFEASTGATPSAGP